MSKRILSLVLVLALVLGSFSMAFAADVPKDVAGTEVESAVTRLAKLGILTGYADGSFKPEGNITRAEFSAVVSRARGLEQAALNAKGNTTFGDVPASHWASGYVNVADNAGLIKGMGKVNGVNTFAPEANITYEQAVTLVVRALGYEPAAIANGGYPNGYLIVASQEGLLKNVKAVQGEIATRALVAQLTDNALDVPKMIQVGYGDQAKFVKSGTEFTTERFLFDDLGLERLVKATITEANSDKNKVTIKGLRHKDDTREIAKSLIVSSDFNFAGLEGLRVTAWYNDKKGELIDVRLESDNVVMFDAIEVTKDSSGKEEIKLITEDSKYDVDKNAAVKLDGTKGSVSDLTKGDKYSFAKVIINEYNDVSWIEAYSLDEVVVVKEVKGKIVKGYGNSEIDDINKYTIIKDGKQISEKDLEDEDLVVYNSKEEYAVVVTKSVKGKIDRVYNEGFKIEGTTYDYAVPYASKSTQYINGEDLNDVDSDVAEEMQDNGEVEVMLSFDKKALLVKGEVKEISSNYVMVSSTTKNFNTRGEAYKTLDVLNAEGSVVKYEVKLKDINDSKEDFLKTEAKWDNEIVEGNVIKLSLDSKNNPSKVEATNSKSIKSKVDVDASFIEGYKTKGNALVFWKDGEEKVKDYSVLRWSDAKSKFSEVQSGEVFANKDGEVVAVFAEKTNNETKTKDVVGVITKIKELSKKDNRYDVTIEVNGKETTYEAKDASFGNLKADDIVAIQVTEDNEAKSYKAVSTKVVTVDSATTGKLTDSDKVEYTIDGKYYDKIGYALKTVNARDINKGDKVTLYFQPNSTKFVQVVVLGDRGTTTPDTEAEKLVKAKEELAKAKTVAVEKVAADYTAASFKALTDAQALAEGTRTEIETKTAAINAAIANLKPATSETEVTAEAEFVLNPIVKKYVLRVKLSDATKTVEKFIIDGVDTEVHSVQDGHTVSKGTFEAKASAVKVVVDGKTIIATIK